MHVQMYGWLNERKNGIIKHDHKSHVYHVALFEKVTSKNITIMYKFVYI